MATVFETRLIGNLGRDASVRNMERGVIAINFPVAHNKNWRDKKTGETKTRTTWVNCTIWKKEGANMRVLDFLTRGTMVELIGTPFAKAYQQEDGSVKTEIRLNVSKTNILKPSHKEDRKYEDYHENFEDEIDSDIEDFTLDDDEF
jgi:single-strand DNA-binding protein